MLLLTSVFQLSVKHCLNCSCCGRGMDEWLRHLVSPSSQQSPYCLNMQWNYHSHIAWMLHLKFTHLHTVTHKLYHAQETGCGPWIFLYYSLLLISYFYNGTRQRFNECLRGVMYPGCLKIQLHEDKMIDQKKSCVQKSQKCLSSSTRWRL